MKVDLVGREGVLSSLTTALGVPRRTSTMPTTRGYAVNGAQRRELLKGRLVGYRTNVVECDEASLPSTINALLVAQGSEAVTLPCDIPTAWLHSVAARFHRDDPVSTIRDLDGVDSSPSGCAVAIAQTGTINLDSGVQQGPGALAHSRPPGHRHLRRVDRRSGRRGRGPTPSRLHRDVDLGALDHVRH